MESLGNTAEYLSELEGVLRKIRSLARRALDAPIGALPWDEVLAEIVALVPEEVGETDDDGEKRQQRVQMVRCHDCGLMLNGDGSTPGLEDGEDAGPFVIDNKVFCATCIEQYVGEVTDDQERGEAHESPRVS